MMVAQVGGSGLLEAGPGVLGSGSVWAGGGVAWRSGRRGAGGWLEVLRGVVDARLAQ